MFKPLVCLLCCLLCISVMSLHAEEPNNPKLNDPADAKVREALNRKVSFEFVDTPFEDAVNFLKSIAQVNFVVDQATRAAAPAISLKATDVSLEKALTYIAHLTQTTWSVHDEAVFISITKEALAQLKKEDQGHQDTPVIQHMEAPAKVHAKFANGNEIEVTGTIGDDPDAMAQTLIERSMDLATDGLLAYRTDAFPEKIKAGTLPGLLETQAKVSVTNNQAFKLLLIKGEPAELRKVQAIMRALGCSLLAKPEDDDGEQAEPEEEAKPQKPVQLDLKENF